MVNFKTTEDKVLYLLENYPNTRKCDSDLILAVYALVDRNVVNLSFKEVMNLTKKSNKFPSFETIRRTRQKLQANNPDLKDKGTAKIREGAMQESYKDYALS